MLYREAVVVKPIVDLHAKPNIRSERVTQTTLGTPLIVGKEAPNWFWVTAPDAYRGWIEVSATRRLKRAEPRYASTGRTAAVTSNLAVIYLERSREPRESLQVVVGTRLELVAELSHSFKVRLPDGQLGSVRKEDVEVHDGDFRYPVTTRRKVVATAKRFLGVPYLWGGTTPLGFDCSGLVQLAYRLNGVELPRDADQQFAVGQQARINQLDPADLVFFSSKGTGITHVGIFAGDGRFLHSAGNKGVTVTPFRDPYYQSIFVGARKVWPS